MVEIVKDELEREREKRSIGALEILIKYPEFKTYQNILEGQIEARRKRLATPLTVETLNLHNQLVGEIDGLILAKNLAHATVRAFTDKKETEQVIKQMEDEFNG